MLSATRDELHRRCLKPRSDEIGSWTARRLARPVALHITRIVLPLGATANQATLAAVVCSVAAAVAFAQGSALGWLGGALLLQAWYVLDHVDGQLARWNRTASLDGTTLDYLMHHGVNLVIPQAISIGLVRQGGDLNWFWLGTLWSWGLVTVGLRHDARYKAFVQRLKNVEGHLVVVGAGGGRRTPSPWPRRTLRSIASWSVQKLCEMHVLAHWLLVAATARWLFIDADRTIATATTVAMALAAVPAAIWFTARDCRRGEAEREFAAWYRVPENAALEFRDGRWIVTASPDESHSCRAIRETANAAQSS